METIIRCGCGLDVHKDSVVACIRLVEPTGTAQKEVRTFGTTTGELLKLSDWLSDNQVTRAAMEATGVYWVRREVAAAIVSH